MGKIIYMKNKIQGGSMTTTYSNPFNIQSRTITPFQKLTGSGIFGNLPVFGSLFGGGFGKPTGGIIPIVGFEGDGLKRKQNVSKMVKSLL